jgi:hypothetical protein
LGAQLELLHHLIHIMLTFLVCLWQENLQMSSKLPASNSAIRSYGRDNLAIVSAVPNWNDMESLIEEHTSRRAKSSRCTVFNSTESLGSKRCYTVRYSFGLWNPDLNIQNCPSRSAVFHWQDMNRTSSDHNSKCSSSPLCLRRTKTDIGIASSEIISRSGET